MRACAARIIAGSCALGVSAGWNITNVGPIADGEAKAYGVGLVTVGLFTTALFVGHLLAQIPSGRAIDLVGARRVGLAALLGIAACNTVLLATPSPALALALRAVAGIGTGAVFVAGATTPARRRRRSRRGFSAAPRWPAAGLRSRSCRCSSTRSGGVLPGGPGSGSPSPQYRFWPSRRRTRRARTIRGCLAASSPTRASSGSARCTRRRSGSASSPATGSSPSSPVRAASATRRQAPSGHSCCSAAW